MSVLTDLAAASNPISSVTTFLGKVVERIWPDPVEQEKAKVQLATLAADGTLKAMAMETGLLEGQIEINKIDAASPSMFKSGWRPALAWMCVVILGLYYVPRIVFGMYFWVLAAAHSQTLPPLPDMGVMDILGLVATLLGSAGIRMTEKIKGVVSI